MNARELMESKMRERHGHGAAVVEAPPEAVAVLDDVDLQTLTERELKRLVHKPTDMKEKIAILKVAVAFIGVKAKVPVSFGSALDDE